MKFKIFTTILLIIPFLSWGQGTEDLPYIHNDAFVANAFGFPVTIQNLKKNYGNIFTITKKPFRNIHTKTVVDTIYTFSAGKTKIEVYKAKQGELLQFAYIDTEKISLKYNIKVGDAKTDVAQKLKTKITADKVQVGDLEQGEGYTFLFSSGKLQIISYESYID